jgi:hypothetical protein
LKYTSEIAAHSVLGVGNIENERLGQKSYWPLSKEYTRNDKKLEEKRDACAISYRKRGVCSKSLESL